MKGQKFLLAAMLLILTVLSPLQASANSTPFKDVTDRHWAKDAIQWAYDEKLTSGYPDGTFRPDKPITEAQFVTMLVRFDCSSPSSFASWKGEHKAMGNYRYLARNFIKPKGFSNPSARDASIKKSDAAQILAAYQGKDLSIHEAVYYLYVNDIASGITGKNDYSDFGPNHELTRAEAVSYLYRMSRVGDCEIQGLKSSASGKHNEEYAYPASFHKGGTQEFEKPMQPNNPGTTNPPSSKPTVDIEKEVLTSNGRDSTFITFTFRDCDGNVIPYSRELEFDVTSKEGATIEADHTVKESWEYDPRFGYHRVVTKHRAISDGPEVTVKVTAPRTDKKKVDTITVTPVNKYNGCSLPPVTATLTYEPKAEIHLEVKPDPNYPERSILQATLLRPGGSQIYGFNGFVKLESASGRIPIANNRIYFSNGYASISFVNPQFLLKDDIQASLIPDSIVYDDDVRSILNKTFTVPVAFSPPIRKDMTCSAEDSEIGFVVDSSGSMKRNDPGYFRVSKTREFINSLQAEQNITVRFNSAGYLLNKGNAVDASYSLRHVDAKGGTDIADGMREAIRHFTTATDKQKYIVLVTDGKSSIKPILDQAKVAKNRGIRVFTIGLGKDADESLLRDVAYMTNGSYYKVQESTELSLIYQAILQEINCGIPMPSCSTVVSIFHSPVVKLRGNEFIMETEASNTCGTLDKVIVRFSSVHGDVDYRLIPRGQNFYKLNKYLHEIKDIHLYDRATFIGFVGENEVSRQTVSIQK